MDRGSTRIGWRIVLVAMTCWLLHPSMADDVRVCPSGTDRADPGTLEDIYGDTGERFQAGIGLVAFEKTDAGALDPEPGYGIAVDDMVIQWKEFDLVPDATICAVNGECAVLILPSVNLYDGRTVVPITLMENSPPLENDCDLDGSPDGTQDCDGNLVPDLVVFANSEAEPAGEIIVLNLDAGAVYRGELPVSTGYDVPGTLFLSAPGIDTPTMTVVYQDEDDGTGQPCRNNVNGELQGRIEASIAVFSSTGHVVVNGALLTDNGDNDGWADTFETVNMRITVSNKTGRALTGMVARLSTSSPWIDCIVLPFVNVGDLAVEEVKLSTEEFVFRVGDVDRTGLGLGTLDELSAEFDVRLEADQFVTTELPQSVTIELDLDATGGSGPMTFFEGFESGTFGAFTTMNLDAGAGVNETSDDGMGGILHDGPSDGYRCNYSDPDDPNSNSYGLISDCWMGATPAQADAFFWQNTAIGAPGSYLDRAFEGNNSLFYGVDLGADGTTTPMAVLEAVRTIFPVHLQFQGVTPELRFMHQISLMDSRSVGVSFGESADRGVVQVQVADPATSDPIGDWIKLQPYLNVYDQQGTDNYTNCLFDPIDDGSNEDDRFDPSDPTARLGPSSTCYPEFSFVYLGDTDGTYIPAALGNASDGPGLEGSTGLGTWVESKFNLDRFRGRSLRMRFLASALKAGSFEDYEAIFQNNPDPSDDGWWIDSVTVSSTFANPSVVSNDDKDNSLLEACGATCNTVTAELLQIPSASGAPGHMMELDAAGSTADRCVDGVLQYRFWLDGDGDQAGGGFGDILLRSWSDNPVYIDAPSIEQVYVVEVRCATDHTCADDAWRRGDILNCRTLSAALETDPAEYTTPGNPIELDASLSSADRCWNGELEYQFWLDSSGGALLQFWSETATYTDHPTEAPVYSVEVRCTSDPIDCYGTAVVNLTGTCTTVTAALSATPPGPVAPGTTVDLDATGSVADTCNGDILEYRFSIDNNGNGAGGDPGDTLLQDWSETPTASDAPTVTARFAVDVRCQSDPDCSGSASVVVEVTTGGGGGVFEEIGALDKNTFAWQETSDVDYVKGDLRFVSFYKIIDGNASFGVTSFDTTFDVPDPGRGFFYLVKDVTEPAGAKAAGGRAPERPSWGTLTESGPFLRDDHLPDTGCYVETPEIWVLNETSKSFDIVDSCTELRIDGGLLTGGPAGAFAPRGIVFSTIDGAAGQFVYITQGPYLRVIDAATRTIQSTTELAPLTGLPGGSSVTLTGLDAARLQDFDGNPGVAGPARAFLYVAADVVTPGGPGDPPSGPYFFILDQEQLAPAVGAPVVDSGPLFFGTCSVSTGTECFVDEDCPNFPAENCQFADSTAEALDATTIAAADPVLGFQRGWFTLRDGGTLLRAVLVSTAESANPAPDWKTVRVVERNVGAVLPDGLTVGAGPSGALSAMPEGPAGSLRLLDDPDSLLCDFSGGRQRAVAIDGPASGGQTLYALDQDFDGAGNGKLRVVLEDQIDPVPGDCPLVGEFIVGADPTALGLLGQGVPERALVASRGADSLDIIRNPTFGSTTTSVALPAADGPIDVAVQATPATACTIENVTTDGKSLSWTTVGCATDDVFFSIWCQCTSADPADCDICPHNPPGKEVGEDPWEELGLSDNGTFDDQLTGAGESTTYTVILDGKEPLTLD